MPVNVTLKKKNRPLHYLLNILNLNIDNLTLTTKQRLFRLKRSTRVILEDSTSSLCKKKKIS